MYYINYDSETGDILGIYPSSMNYNEVPDPKITITDEEYALLGEGYYRVVGGQLELATPPDTGDDPTDPEPTPTDDTEARIAALQTEFLDNFTALKTAFIGASILEETEIMNEIRNDYRALMGEFTSKVRTIEEGDYPTISTNNYCAICGTVIVDGVCPRCHWRQ